MHRDVSLVLHRLLGHSHGLVFATGDGLLVLRIENLRDLTLELFFLRLHVLDGEGDDRATDLNSHGVRGLQSELVFQQNDGSELGGIVFNVESVWSALDESVASAH